VDSIVVLISAVDGIQSNTELIINALQKEKLPAIFFINKSDRDIADPEKVIKELKQLCPTSFNLLSSQDILETAAEYDDNILSLYSEGKNPDKKILDNSLKKLSKKGITYPILKGSAVTGDGVKELLDAITEFLPPPENNADKPLSAVIFSVEQDKSFGRGAYIRLFSGTLSVRDIIKLNNNDFKITQIKTINQGRITDTGVVSGGQLALVYGLSSCKTGDVIGDIDRMVLPGILQTALLSVKVTQPSEIDVLTLKTHLEQLTAEDPSLDLSWEPISKSLNIKVFGPVQTEILEQLIKERFGYSVIFGNPEVIYKETPAKPSIGFDAYTMPKPSWAVLRFEITPLSRGSGLVYKCTVPPNRLNYRYRKQVEMSLKASLAQGLLGWEVTDLELNLVDGEDHHIHTHPLDFTIATPLAIMDGLRNAGTILLEPLLNVRFTVSQNHLGRLMSDILRMRGSMDSQQHRGEYVIVEATIPVSDFLGYSGADSKGYPITFASFTSGRGIITATFKCYGECPLELGKTTERRGVNPLDRSKYILAARHALQGTVFE
jgi:ribosomal protection tetracycline resistance protein